MTQVCAAIGYPGPTKVVKAVFDTSNTLTGTITLTQGTPVL
jgi:hypothetical protein